MNNRIGIYEGASIIVISALPVYIYSILGQGMASVGASYWLNFIISAVIAYFLLFILKKGIVHLGECKDKVLVYIFGVIYFIFIMSYGIYCLSISTGTLHQISAMHFSFEEILYFTLLGACFCSSCGVEALTRTSYLILCILFAIVVTMYFITFKGWSLVNFTPVLGNNVKETFFNVWESIPLSGIVSSLFIVNYYRDGKKGYAAIKKSLTLYVAFAFLVVILCSLCTPYPMILQNSFALKAVFSMAKPGTFFHRFETLLVVFVVLINVMSTSFYMSMTSAIICKLSSFYDARVYILAISGLFFFATMIPEAKKLALGTYLCSVALLFIFILVLPVVSYIKRRKNAIS